MRCSGGHRHARSFRSSSRCRNDCTASKTQMAQAGDQHPRRRDRPHAFNVAIHEQVFCAPPGAVHRAVSSRPVLAACCGPPPPRSAHSGTFGQTPAHRAVVKQPFQWDPPACLKRKDHPWQDPASVHTSSCRCSLLVLGEQAFILGPHCLHPLRQPGDLLPLYTDTHKYVNIRTRDEASASQIPLDEAPRLITGVHIRIHMVYASYESQERRVSVGHLCDDDGLELGVGGHGLRHPHVLTLHQGRVACHSTTVQSPQ